MSEDNLFNEGMDVEEYNIVLLRNDNVTLRNQLAQQSEMLSAVAAENIKNNILINELRQSLNTKERQELLVESSKQTAALEQIAAQLLVMNNKPPMPQPLTAKFNPYSPFGPYISNTTAGVEPVSTGLLAP